MISNKQVCDQDNALDEQLMCAATQIAQREIRMSWTAWRAQRQYYRVFVRSLLRVEHTREGRFCAICNRKIGDGLMFKKIQSRREHT